MLAFGRENHVHAVAIHTKARQTRPVTQYPEPALSTPIYKNEQSWRAHLLMTAMANRHSLRRVEMTVVGSLALYLFSTYSLFAAAIAAGIWWLSLALLAYGDDKSRKRMVAAVEADADLDI